MKRHVENVGKIMLMRKFGKVPGLVLAVMLALMPACSAGTNTVTSTATPEASAQALPTASPTPAPKTAITPQADLPEGIQLTLWHPWTGKSADWLAAATDNFNRTNSWGVVVTLQTHADELVLQEDIAQASQTGSLPDVVVAPGAYLKIWNQTGLKICDLNDYVNSSTVGWMQAQQNSFLPIFWKTDLDGDFRLGLPALRTGNYLFYNRSWAQDLGFKNDPQNSQEFQEQACAAGKANMHDAITQNNGTGGWFYSSKALPIYSWMKAFSGDQLDSEGKVDFQADGTQNSLEYLFGLYNQNCAWSGKQSTPYRYFSDRYALFYSGDSRDILTQENVDLQAKTRDKWILLPYPSDQNRPVVLVDGYSYAVLSSDDDHALAAWLYLRFLMETQNQVDLYLFLDLGKTGDIVTYSIFIISRAWSDDNKKLIGCAGNNVFYLFIPLFFAEDISCRHGVGFH